MIYYLYMKWIGISGSRLLTSSQVEEDVRREVRTILEQGDGIVTGGALGVDSFAMDEVYILGYANSRLKVC
jgi:predicted Rossmann fold nucleotide-binding protein DprA/Smf involved in DNA uptake